MGTPLFARTKRQVVLTPAGHQLLGPARRMLDELERGLKAARRAASGEIGRLSLRFTMMAALTPLPRALARFQREHPDVEVTIAPGGSTNQLEALRLGRADIGFMALKKDVAPLACEIVEKSPLVAVLPARHPLAKRRAAPLRDLVRERQIMLGEASEPGVRAALRRRFAELGVVADVALEVEQIETLLAFVAAGVGVALVPGFVRKLRFPGVAIVPVSPTISGGISAVWSPDTLPPTGQRFLVLREVVAAQHSTAPDRSRRDFFLIAARSKTAAPGIAQRMVQQAAALGDT